MVTAGSPNDQVAPSTTLRSMMVEVLFPFVHPSNDDGFDDAVDLLPFFVTKRNNPTAKSAGDPG